MADRTVSVKLRADTAGFTSGMARAAAASEGLSGKLKATSSLVW